MAEAWWVYAAAAGIGSLAGILIGAVGVGGIVIVPLLILLPGIGVQEAVASSLFAYIFAGVAGTGAYVRGASIHWPAAVWYILGSIPAAFAGAFVLDYLSDFAVKAALYSLIIVSAVFSLYKSFAERSRSRSRSLKSSSGGGGREAEPLSSSSSSRQPIVVNSGAGVPGEPGPEPARYQAAEAAWTASPDSESGEGRPAATLQERAVAVAIGAFTGFGSALTGSSGPVIILPILLSLDNSRDRVLESLGTAQVIQVPIALASTIAFVTLRPGTIDFVVGGSLAAGMVPLVLLGSVVAHKAPAGRLKQAVAVLLVVGGAALMVQLLLKRFR